ncbi:MAG: amidohydrolase [Acidimicrobiia bacterium]|nr:amidohydrolase [Acidimicrobiia bacterium]
MQPSLVIDSDSHLFERPETWVDHIDPSWRDDALRIDNDELGHPWLTHRGRRLMLTWLCEPGRLESIGDLIEDQRAGRPARFDYARDLPTAHWDPGLRRDRLDEWGIDESVVFPQWGINWELWLGDDLGALRANMAAWNRWAVEVRAEGRGRLHPVGHVSLRGDLDWLDGQLAVLAAADIRLALLRTGVVDGKRLSHPDLDQAWSLFERHGVTPTFHVGGTSLVGLLDPAQTDNDDVDYMPLMSFPLHGVDAQVALCDLVLNGVLERHPNLRFAVVELLSRWLPELAIKLDLAYDNHRRISGHHVQPLSRRPSEYLKSQVRVSAFASEQPASVMAQVGPMLMFGGDYPHPEGFERPLEEYRARSRAQFDPDTAARFFGGNLAELVHR